MYKLCKTEQSAQRQRELEQSLVALMGDRRYEEITVSEFCAYAGIPRKAFYRYFSSKDGALYALLDHTMMEYQLFREPYGPGEPRTLERDLESFFLFWKKQHELLDALKNSGLSGILMERAINSVCSNPAFNRLLPGESSSIRDHVLRFSVCGLMIMMVNWHLGGFRENPREMAEIATRLVTKPLFPYIKELI